MTALWSRRHLLQVGAGAVVVAAAAACRSTEPFACVAAPDLSADDAKLRTTLVYVDAAADPTKACVNCAQYVAAPDDGSCGSCRLMRGPIHPNGSCKLFAPKG